jgi:hypothetical protein
MEQNNPENERMSFEDYEQYVDALKSRLQSVPMDQMELWDLINKKADDLREKYKGNQSRYASWHILGGSDLEPSALPECKDFPGEDSIELWLEELEQKLKSEEEKE